MLTLVDLIGNTVNRGKPTGILLHLRALIKPQTVLAPYQIRYPT